VDHFGTWKPKNGKPLPMARISQMFDPLIRITTHALISPKNVGERDLAAAHFKNLTAQDLVLLDRGYPAFWIFNLIISKDAQFCVRISVKKRKIVRKFIKSGKQNQVISLEAKKTSLIACQKHRLDSKPMRLRLVRVELESGETEELITSLTNAEEFPFQMFQELYFDRWPVEEDYKVMKCRIEMENFSGKSTLSVYQDFHALIFTKNITSMFAFAAQPALDKAVVENIPNSKSTLPKLSQRCEIQLCYY
jgi:hypothetical protein